METEGQDAVVYRLLGALEVRSNGRAIDLGPPKQRALLAILLLHAGEVDSTERLIELVWGEHPPRTASHSIQIYVSGLRKALGRDAAIVTRTPGYLLQADRDSIDALRFRRLVREGGTQVNGDPQRGAALLREALELWRGAPLADFAYEEFAGDPARSLEEVRLDAIEALAAAELASGREQDALVLVEAAIPEDPLRERLRELQVMALYRCGRHPDALRAFQ
jgi:DNA-binding SARP family transcriptional activator